MAFDGVRVSPLRKSEILGRPTLLLLRPIPPPGSSERRGRALGYFVERFDLRELESMLAEDATDLAPAPWLLDAQGHILARTGKVVDDAGVRPFPFPPASVSSSASGGFVAQGTLPEIGPSVFGLRNLTGAFPGRLVAAVPSARAFQALTESRRGLILTGAAAAFMIAILNFVGARELMRPILLLSEGAKRVAGGDLEIYLPVRGNDEIADLTRAFNDMAQRIREGRESVESARDELSHVNAGLRDANRALETLAITDGLTSLFNRRHFQDTFETEIRRAEQQGRVLSLLIIDIDHFKQYNDRFGHPEGDAALRGGPGHEGDPLERPRLPLRRRGTGRAAARVSPGPGGGSGGEAAQRDPREYAAVGPVRRTLDRIHRRGHVPRGRARGQRPDGAGGRGSLCRQGQGPRPRRGQQRGRRRPAGDGRRRLGSVASPATRGSARGQQRAPDSLSVVASSYPRTWILDPSRLRLFCDQDLLTVVEFWLNLDNAFASRLGPTVRPAGGFDWLLRYI